MSRLWALARLATAGVIIYGIIVCERTYGVGAAAGWVLAGILLVALWIALEEYKVLLQRMRVMCRYYDHDRHVG